MSATTPVLIKTARLHEHVVPGKRLGRHVRHDPRSFGYPAPMAAEPVTTKHVRSCPIFDQGEVGSCTGNAGLGMMNTAPFPRADGAETDAVQLYSEATKLDDVQGTYPPDDTGSSGLAIMKALVARKWLTKYAHAFGLQPFLRALVLRPGIVGMAWREQMDRPNAAGVVRYKGGVRGGHEIEALALDVDAKLVWFANSWGADWGLQGYFALSWDDVGEALADDGDATFGW